MKPMVNNVLRLPQKRIKRRHSTFVVATLLVLTSCTSQSAEDTATTEAATPSTSQSTPSTPSTSAQPSSGTWAAGNYGLLPITEADEPVAAVSRADSTKLWVGERPGTVRSVELTDVQEPDDPSAPITIQAADTTVLDISDRVSTEGDENGLLGIAFSPDGNFLYVSYTNADQNSVIAEFPMEGDSAVDEERVLLQIEQPFPNHNAGDLQFGPDGMLYVALGDGGSAGDPEQNGQNPSTLLGSILRIDPTSSDDSPYTTPEDNPFTAANNPTEVEDARPETWAYGVRNPWRFSFDSQTGDLWIGDVGQDRFEEINYLPAAPEGAGRGSNLGWSNFEGAEPFEGQPEPDNHHAPLLTYETTDDQCSVIGGFVYRGGAIEVLNGVYLYSDFCGDSISGIELQDGEIVTNSALTINRSLEGVTSFGQGPAGEIYVLEQGGQVSRIIDIEDGGAGVV